MVQTVTSPKNFVLNKPFCGSIRARWLVSNPSEEDLVAQLQLLLLPSHDVAAAGPTITIPPGGSRNLVLSWGQLRVAGDYVLVAADGAGAPILDTKGKPAVKRLRLFLTT